MQLIAIKYGYGSCMAAVMFIFHYLVRADLRRLIFLVAIASVLITLGNSYFAIYKVQRGLLIEATLESNRRYAAKVAESAQMLLSLAERQMSYSAEVLELGVRIDPETSEKTYLLDEHQAEYEAARLVGQSDLFNSAIVVNDKAEVVAVAPHGLLEKGYLLPEHTRQSYYVRKPLVTDPFYSVSGNTLVSVSHPIWGKNGDYLGYVSGTIYLNKNGLISRLMREHFFTDSSYLYVVDSNGVLLFHVDPSRIGENMSHMPLVQQVIQGGSGTEEVINSVGVDMLAGYASVPAAKWGVVVQRPKEKVLSVLNDQVWHVFWHSLPIAILTLVGIWGLAFMIAKPLRQLAKNAGRMNDSQILQSIISIRSWYYEASQLKMAILQGIGMFNQRIHELDNDSHTDPLTQLFNRRGMQRLLDDFEARRTQFSVLTLDIDYFKRVNDRFGHDVGDQVICELANVMKTFLREQDIACRVGGEEFLIFLPYTTLENAVEMAESLRMRVASAVMPKVETITVSIGVSCVNDSSSMEQIEVAIKRADTELYEAKNAGRNCVRAA